MATHYDTYGPGDRLPSTVLNQMTTDIRGLQLMYGPGGSGSAVNGVFRVDSLGAVADGSTDNYLPITVALTAACAVNGVVEFGEGVYVTSPLTIGATGSYGSCALQGVRMYAQYADTAVADGKGTSIKLANGSNGHLFSIPPADASDVGPGPPRFTDLWLDGNRSNQDGGLYWLVDMPNHTATANKCRSAMFERIRGTNCYGGIRAGTARNAGMMDAVAILGTVGPAFQLGSCDDWRIINGDFYSTTANCYYAPGGASVIFTATNFFSTTTHGVKIDSSAGDHTFYGCSFDRNGQAGIYALGTSRPVTLVGCRFTLNGQTTTNTYSDVVADGGERIHLIGCKFERGGLTNRPKYCVETKNGALDIVVIGSHIAENGGILPYATSFTNDTSVLIQHGDAITGKNFWVDYDAAAVNRVRVKGGTSSNPAIVGANGETNASLSILPEGIGDLQLGRSTSKLGFYGVATPRSKQTVTGSKGANAALTSLLTALANLGLITDSSS